MGRLPIGLEEALEWRAIKREGGERQHEPCSLPMMIKASILQQALWVSGYYIIMR